MSESGRLWMVFFVPFVFIFALSGCSTTRIDWEMAGKINTIKAYQNFVHEHPDSEFSGQARAKLEYLYYQRAKDALAVIDCSIYLLKYPQGTHAEEVRVELEDIRCKDPSLMKNLPAWLRKGNPSDPQSQPRWLLRDAYIGVQPGRIASGFKAAGDDPAFPMEIEVGSGYLVYYGGRGIIEGPGDITVLVGYDCKESSKP